MRKIKKGDLVVVLSGKSKGVQGKVLKVITEENRVKVLVENANLVSKHVKPNPNTNTQGGIVKREAALPISKVALVNLVGGKNDRVGFKTLPEGKKVRYFKSNNELVEA
jgi:large subunit ribosomal protein L24